MVSKTLLSLACGALFTAFAASAGAAEIDPDSEADNYADVWVRLDADRVGLNAWVGGTTPIGPLELASNVIVSQGWPGAVDPIQGSVVDASGDDYRAPALRLELGPAFATGGFFFLPKVGFGYDLEREKFGPLVPQLFTIIQAGPAYFESWVQFYFYNFLDEGTQDSFYTRDMLLVALSNQFAVGAEVDLTVAIKNSPGKALRSLALGPTATYSPWEPFTVGLFVGYEFQKSARNSEHDFLAGRVTVTYLW
jgi:hypothetical protein